MPWQAYVAAAFYAAGWTGFVVAEKPDDSAEGALVFVYGVLWPVFALGWLVSRPWSRG